MNKVAFSPKVAHRWLSFRGFFLLNIACGILEAGVEGVRGATGSTGSAPFARASSGAGIAMGRLSPPLVFVQNRGQWGAPYEFVTHGGSVPAALGRDGFLVCGKEGVARVRFTFEGASSSARLIGENPRAGHYNYYHGNEAERWYEKVPAFSSVRYCGLYEGIDARLREENGRLEYDLLLEPQADLGRVVIRCEGIESIELSNDGGLLLHTAKGVLRQTPPKTWEVLPDGARRQVQCGFRKIGERSYGFEAAQRDRNRALVIDPGLEWSTYLGGAGSDQITAMAAAEDGSGDLFVAGYMNSPDFPFFNDANFSGFQNRVFVARLDATGTSLRWTTFLGGWHSQVTYRGLAAAVDGGVVVTGENVSPDFPTTPGAFDRTASFRDAFVARLNASGGLVFSTLLGGSGVDQGYAVGFDPAGNIVVGGNTSSADFPTTAGAFDRAYANPSDASQGDAHGDIFITRLTPDGRAVTYSTLIGGRSADVLEDMEVDALGFVNLAGWISGHNVEVFPTTADAFDRTWGGNQDAIFARLKLDGAGAADLKYSTLMGGSNQDDFFAVAVDPSNPEIVTVAGMSWSDNFPVTPGVVKTTNPRFSSLFESQAAVVARFHLPAAGPRTLTWSTYLGPAGPAANIRATDVTVTSAGEPIVVGLMGDRRFPTTRGAFDRTAEGFLNGGANFIARLRGDATQYQYSSYFGVGDADNGFLSPRVVYFGGNTVVVAGTTGSASFPITAGAFDTAYGHPEGGGSDGFVFRFATDPDNSGDLTVGVPSPLSPPNGASAPSGTFMARLQWTEVPDPSGIDGYEFEMSTRADFTNATPGTVHTTEVILPPPGTGESGLTLATWYWRVRAYDRAGNVGAWSATSSFTLNAANTPPAMEFVDTYPRKVVGGGAAVGVLQLDKPAPPGGQVITLHLRYNTSVGYLAQNRPIPVAIPATVTIPAGQVSALFDISTAPVSQNLAVDVVAMANGIGRSCILHVTTSPEMEVSGLVVSPNTVEGGTASTGTVTLKRPAPPGGVVVDLGTSHPQAARTPATVTVPEGATRATFPITTLPVAFDIDSFVDASTASSLGRQYIFVKPPGWPRLSGFTLSHSSAGGGTLVTGTVTFDGVVPFSTWPAFLDARVMVSSSDPTVAGMSPFVTVLSGQSSGTFTFVTRSVPTNTPLVLSAAYGSVLLTAPLMVNAGPPVAVSSVGLNVSTVRGGQGGIATVTLSAPAPAGGVSVLFTTSDPDIYFSSTPVAFVSQGSTIASVAFIADTVSATKVVNIIASYGTSSASAAVTVNPSDAANRWVTSVTLSPASVAAGSGSTGTLTLNAPAPSGGVVVQLFSSTSAAIVPASVTVPPGASSVNFAVSTVSASSSVTAKIYALLNFSIAGVLNISAAPAPPPAPGTPSLVSPANGATPTQPVTLDWTDTSNAVSYEIQVDDSSSFTTPLVRSLTSTASQTTVTGLAGVRHWWRVRARNSAGVAGSFSASRSFTPRTSSSGVSLTGLSLSPSAVVGGNSSQGTVSLSGAAPSGGIVVTLSSNNTNAIVPASITVAAGAASASFTVSTRSVSSSISATISGAYNGVSRSGTLSINPASGGALPAPSLVSPSNDARFDLGQTITFDWSDVAGAASYTLQVDDSSSFPSPLVLSQTVTLSRHSTSTLPARTLWWRVRANDSSGNPGSWSSIRRFEVRD